jgi:hypothetical protein
MERDSRYWFVGLVGKRENILFKKGMEQLWAWAKPAEFIRLFTDGEYRYSKEGDWGNLPPAHFRNYLWPLAHEFLKPDEVSSTYQYRKVWRQGLEVACKVKGSQGTPRRVWRYRAHPYTAISNQKDVHANHQEAFNASLRRRCSAYRRRQNLYAKRQDALQRTLTMQQMIHNWVRRHFSLPKNTTPAMRLGYIDRPVSLYEMLTYRGFNALSS